MHLSLAALLSAFTPCRLHPYSGSSRCASRAQMLLDVRQSAHAEQRLLSLVAVKDSPRSAVVAAFDALEASAPAPKNLLLTSDGVTLVDGRWSLIGSIAARVGDEEGAEGGISGAVNASGIVIDASATRRPVQQIDVSRRRIGNEIAFELPLLKRSAIVRVAGSFEPDTGNARRAYADFDTLDLFLIDGGEGGTCSRLLRAGWLFSLVRALRPGLINGREEETSWLETTYITDRVRLGRGNKGSVFVLTRSEDGDGPLSAWPL